MSGITLRTVEDVARIMQMHPQTIYRLVREKKLRGYKVGGSWRFTDENIREYLGTPE